MIFKWVQTYSGIRSQQYELSVDERTFLRVLVKPRDGVARTLVLYEMPETPLAEMVLNEGDDYQDDGLMFYPNNRARQMLLDHAHLLLASGELPSGIRRGIMSDLRKR